MDKPSASAGGKTLSSLVQSAPPFVGRREQLAWVERILQETLAGQPRVLLMPGNAGIGKTRLLQEVRTGALRRRLQVGYGRGYYEQSRRYAQQAGDRWFEGWPLQRIPTALILLGRFADAESITQEAYAVAAQTNNWRHCSLTLAALVCSALAKGDLQALERYGEETMAIVSRSCYPFGGAMVLPAVACANACRGAWTVAENALSRLVMPGQVFESPGPTFNAMAEVFRQLARGYQDPSAASNAPLSETLPHLILQERFDQALLGTYCALIELCALGLLLNPIDPLYQALAQVAERGVLFSRGWVFLIPQILGVAATMDRRWDVAEAHFQAAIDVATDVGACPELRRTYMDYACMLVARGHRGNRRQVTALFGRAHTLFHELGMEPCLRRTEEFAGRFRGRMPQEPHGSSPIHPDKKPQMPTTDESAVGEGTTPSLRIILVTDMASSTHLLQRLGDIKAHELKGGRRRRRQ